MPDGCARTGRWLSARQVCKNSRQCQVTWLSSRLEYWTARGGGAPRGLLEPEPSRGVACLLFGVGAGGADWLGRLAGSVWFAGLEPQAEDFAPHDAARGSWVMPASDGAHIAAETELFFASIALPNAWYAAIAIPRDAGLVELSAALGLVSTLRERRDPLGRRLTVVVTVESSRPSANPFLLRLLDRDAFVVRAGMETAADHLHHFPLRAPVRPRRGRLVCVDLADYLHTWRPRRVADLHVIPSGFEQAVPALQRLPVPNNGVRALNLGLHLDPDAPGNPLVKIDWLATHCRELLLGPEGVVVFTNTDRLDGETGSADLLVVHDSFVAFAEPTIHVPAFEGGHR